mmetsp:Transcript_22577/g.64107  ORF Transcript_22577/g.64107 Transcript_22577/m.64107 type:complete len:255 (+) Transcript_22577:113-877(+)
MIDESSNTTLKRCKVETTSSRKTLRIPSEGSVAPGKNAFQKSSTCTVSKSTSDPALIKNDTLEQVINTNTTTTTTSTTAAAPITPPPSVPVGSTKKSVRFDEVILRNLVRFQEEVDPKEIWYSSQDFRNEAKEIQVLVQQVRQRQQELLKSGIKMQFCANGSPPHPELRGVEELVCPQTFRCRKMRVTQVIKGVLQEQKRQQSQQIRNPLLLSVRCREFSIIAQQLAIQRARYDAKEAAQIASSSSSSVPVASS